MFDFTANHAGMNMAQTKDSFLTCVNRAKGSIVGIYILLCYTMICVVWPHRIRFDGRSACV